jgi:outer membrane receptor protein involved in Fe transport
MSAAALLCFTVAGGAYAEPAELSAGDTADPGAFTDLVVTARKREEAVQTVPISIDAFDQSSVNRLDIRTFEDLRYSAPSVYIAPSTFRQDTLNITIRGQQNFQSTGLQFDTSTAVYVDGVYYARPVGLTGSLFDVAELQILKGPTPPVAPSSTIQSNRTRPSAGMRRRRSVITAAVRSKAHSTVRLLIRSSLADRCPFPASAAT